jgi:uncharacterized protein (DUF1778 family)
MYHLLCYSIKHIALLQQGDYMIKSKDIVNFRVTKQEKEILQEYCELTGRTQTDVYREFIRELSKRLSKLRVSNP